MGTGEKILTLGIQMEDPKGDSEPNFPCWRYSMSILSVSPVSLPNLCLGASISSPTFSALVAPLETILTEIAPLESSCNRPITFTFDHQLKSLIY